MNYDDNIVLSAQLSSNSLQHYFESTTTTTTNLANYDPTQNGSKTKVDSLPSRMARRLELILNKLIIYIQDRFQDHSATSIASLCVVIIVVIIFFCIILQWAREADRKVKEKYEKLNRLNRGSSQSYVAFDGLQSKTLNGLNNQFTSAPQITACSNNNNNKNNNNNNNNTNTTTTTNNNNSSYSHRKSSSSSNSTSAPSPSCAVYSSLINPTTTITTTSTTSNSSRSPTVLSSSPLGTTTTSHDNNNNRFDTTNLLSKQQQLQLIQQLHLVELRRETYFGLVRLSKPGCRTLVLFCDTQSKFKLLTKFTQCIYPYRKNKTLQFSFLLIEKNISWYKDLLRLALNEKRDLQINPINCIGTVLVLNGFKKYFSVYHASDSRCDPDEPFLLLEESLLDNFSQWLENLFAGKQNRYYVKYWPEQMR